MDKLVLITGHKNPDTDSICSVIAYSELKRNWASMQVHEDWAKSIAKRNLF